MLSEIIHHCYTGFGDCVTGFVSSYILRNKLEKITGNKIKLSINWRFVNCPNIDPQYINRNFINRRERSMADCRYSGEDGTLAFSRYYNSPQMDYDIDNRKYLIFITNQYLGKVFVDMTRDEVKEITLEAYNFFWNIMLININISPEIKSYDFNNVIISSIRLGDKYLLGKEKLPSDALTNYKLINKINYPNVVLLGDVDNNILKEQFQNISEKNIISFNGNISHSSCSQMDSTTWEKIFNDLYIMLKSKAIIMMNNDSNFIRIVLFMKNNDHEIYVVNDNNLERVNDSSTLFAKHYVF